MQSTNDGHRGVCTFVRKMVEESFRAHDEIDAAEFLFKVL